MFLAAQEVLKIIADNLKKAVPGGAVSQRLIPTGERAFQSRCPLHGKRKSEHYVSGREISRS